MKRQPAGTDTAEVSLFPFLAVLLCTMGALIVVLVVIARHAAIIRDRAASADARRDDQLDSQRADLEWRIDHLRKSRDTTARQLADKRLELSHVEEHARRLQAQLAELEQAHKQLRTASVDDDQRRLRAELAQTELLAAQARDELDALLARQGSQSESFAIVPYSGSNQTRRRPIYLECRSDSVVFQPEGIVLKEGDFQGTLGPSNPLAAGLRAAREQLVQRRAAGAGDDAEPYPLLLVRPDGILAYYAARAALSSWGTEFGYELIDQDWPLEFPAPEAAVAVAVERAVAEARVRQTLLAQAAPRRARSADRPTFRATPHRGGVVRDDQRTPGGNSGRARRADAGGFGFEELGASRPWGVVNGPEGQQGSAGDRYSGTRGRPSAGGQGEPREGIGGGRYSAESSPRPGASRPGPPEGISGERNAASAIGEGTTPSQPGNEANPGIQNPKSKIQNQPAGTSPASLAKARGENWGLPQSASGSVPITRPITIVCDTEHLSILPDGRNQQGAKVVALAERTEDSVQELVAAVWERIDSWGIAGRGMYWRPTLSFDVVPGGEQRFADLQALLAGSGLDVRARPKRGAAARNPPIITPR